MAHPYLKRRLATEPVSDRSKALEAVLKNLRRATDFMQCQPD